MKKILCALSMIATSSSAFAMHAYNTEDCTYKKGAVELQIHRSLFSNLGPASVKDDGIAAIYLGINDDGVDQEPSAASDDLDLKVLAERQKREKKYSDGCFKGTTWTFKRLVKITTISDKVQAELGLKEGDKLVLSCEGESIFPEGPHCN